MQFASTSLSTESTTQIKRFPYLYALTVELQAFHMVEHLAQIIQKFALSAHQAHGLIGQLDLEQVGGQLSPGKWES